MKVKLLNVDLIRTFGGSVVDMSDGQAKMYIEKGKAVEHVNRPNVRKYGGDESKTIERPPEDKKVWSPPEKKLFSDPDNDLSNKLNPFPGPEDTLFPQIEL